MSRGKRATCVGRMAPSSWWGTGHVNETDLQVSIAYASLHALLHIISSPFAHSSTDFLVAEGVSLQPCCGSSVQYR